MTPFEHAVALLTGTRKRRSGQPYWFLTPLAKRELWEAHAPSGWIDGPMVPFESHYAYGRGERFQPQHHSVHRLVWALTNIPLLKTVDALVQEAVTRYSALYVQSDRVQHSLQPEHMPPWWCFEENIVYPARRHIRMADRNEAPWYKELGLLRGHNSHRSPSERWALVKWEAERRGGKSPREPLAAIERLGFRVDKGFQRLQLGIPRDQLERKVFAKRSLKTISIPTEEEFRLPYVCVTATIPNLQFRE